MPWMAAVIPAVASLAGTAIGGIMSSNTASANRDAQFAMNEQNIALQREFAQQGIRWKVEDAKAAGIHPLFAMGANTASFSPNQFQPVGDDTGGIVQRGLSQFGQDIGRAVTATSTKDQRNNGITSALALERQQLENDLLRSQIVRNLGQSGPPMPSGVGRSGGLAGQQDATLGTYNIEPAEVGASLPKNAGQTAGPAIPQVTWGMSPDARGIQPFPPKALGVEDELGAPLMLDWYIRNRILPNVRSGSQPDMAVVRKMFPGAIGVRWSYEEQRYLPVYPGPNPTSFSRTTSGVRGGQYIRGNPLTVGMPR